MQPLCVTQTSKSAYQLIQNTQAGMLIWKFGVNTWLKEHRAVLRNQTHPPAVIQLHKGSERSRKGPKRGESEQL